jgi:hypothetical protein
MKWAPNIIRLIKSRKITWAGQSTQKCKPILSRTTRGRTPPGRQIRRCENNIKMDLKRRQGGADYMHMVQDTNQWRALVGTAMNIRAA